MNRRAHIKRTMQLAGIALTTPLGLAVFNACESKGQKKRDLILFGKEEMDLVSTICETMLPRTDTPGAIDLKVPEFIERVISSCWKDAGKEFNTGLKQFSAGISAEYSKPFQACSASEREEMIKEMEAPSEKKEALSSFSPHYKELKKLCIMGYMTSEYVMTTLLDYQPIPVEFAGCLDIEGTPVLVADNTI